LAHAQNLSEHKFNDLCLARPLRLEFRRVEEEESEEWSGEEYSEEEESEEVV